MSLLLTGCGRQATKPGGKMIVAASIAPLADFARKVGGDLVEVHLLVPPGASPHIYQPTPDQMKTLSDASVLVLNGVGLEFWADKVVEAAGNPRLIVVETAKGLPIISGDQAGTGNPHVWLDPIYAIHQVEMIRDAYIKADPAHAKQYTSNASSYISRLKELDREIRTQVKTFKSKDFIAYHAAWVYFAKEYGLKEAGVIESSPGKEPSPVEVKQVVDMARRIGAKAIFAEPQFSPKAAQVIANETGAKVLFLDPLGQPPDYDYVTTMRDNLAEMARALK